MPNKKTLYIVGAGASSEAGLPTGEELKFSIAEMFKIRKKSDDNYPFRDKILNDALRNKVGPSGDISEYSEYYKAAEMIRNSMSLVESIDQYIDMHSDNSFIECCGKLAITLAILNAEKNSKLCVQKGPGDSKIDYGSLQDTWFPQFFKKIVDGCRRPEDLATRFGSIAMVIFNYDRCIEHFLFNSLQTVYEKKINAEMAAELVGKIAIYHPYGKVGHLPWQQQGSIDFGGEPTAPQLLSLSNEIRTFTEGTDAESSEISNIQKHVVISERIIFLGFAFHDLNMELLTSDFSDSSSKSSKKCFATAQGASADNRKIIFKKLSTIKQLKKANICLADMSCFQLCTAYENSLSYS